MIITFLSLTVPSLVVSGAALAGLLICLIILQLVDYNKAGLKVLRQQAGTFAWPLLAFFALFLIIEIIQVAV